MNLDAFFKLSYGLYIVSAAYENQFTGHVSNTAFQVTAEPAKFAISTNKDNYTTELISKSKSFCISILEKNVDLEFLGPWGFNTGKEIEKFNRVKYKLGKTGAPVILDKTIAYFDCRVTDTIDLGTHILFIGELIDYDLLNETATPLTYDHYRSVIKGVSPKNSPTYLGDYKIKAPKEELINDIPDKQIYQCVVCGYIYDPEVGDPDSGLAPGTEFEDIPEDWMCPVCGVTKKDFKPVEF